MNFLKHFGAGVAIFGVTVWEGFKYYVMHSEQIM